MKKIALIFSVLALIVGMSASFAPKVFAAGAPHGYTYFDAANPTGVTVTCSPLVGNGEGDYV